MRNREVVHQTCSLNVDVQHAAAARPPHHLHSLIGRAIQVIVHLGVLQEFALIDALLEGLPVREVVLLAVLRSTEGV